MTTQDKLIGATLGGCQIVELLGIGGMARVYRGHQQRLGRTVAVKVLPQHYSGESSFVVRFEQEAQVMAMLHHPNIIQIYDFGEFLPDNGDPISVSSRVSKPNRSSEWPSRSKVR